MSFAVQFVQDSALPEGHDWLIARNDTDLYMFVRESLVTTGVGLRERLAALAVMNDPCPAVRQAKTIVLEPVARGWTRKLALTG